MSKKKITAKAFASQKRKRRQWITFIRMCRYGVNNFSRNAWLTIAATAVMTITLLMVLLTLVSRNILIDSVNVIKDKVDMSIYVKNDTSEEDAKKILSDLEGAPSVKSVEYVSPSDARKLYADANKGDSKALRALNEAVNKLPGTFRVKIDDINNTSELEKFTKTNETLKQNIDEARKPSFAGNEKTAIQNIGKAIGFAEKLGLVVSVILVTISSLIVFNTIRMAIFSRKEEIQMMKLIGADKNFIRGPFIVEAVMYGFIAAIFATGLGLLIVYSSEAKLLSHGVAVANTREFMTVYVAFVLLAMIVVGSLIGILSSLMATRRYLKI